MNRIFGMLCLLFSSFVRSNGFINIVTIIVYWFQQKQISKHIKNNSSSSSLLMIFLSTICCLSPYFIWNFISYLYICHSNYLTTDADTIRFCETSWLPLVYNYLQFKYWGVGFLKSFRVNQIPNFLLAFPIVFISIWFITSFRHVHRPFLLPFVASLVVTIILGLLFAHVQIITRLICSSSPIVYIALAALSLSSQSIWTRRLLWTYLLSFSVGGIALHVNFFPWT